ncbi:MAG: hypothetical protein AABZ47_04320 [Planctomycetota bacterium]
MGPEALTKLLKTAPFEPLELGLSDGRVIVVRHPDQVVPAGRHIIIGLAQVEDGRRRLSTPTTKGRIVKDWLLVDLIHVVSAEPANGQSRRRRRAKK